MAMRLLRIYEAFVVFVVAIAAENILSTVANYCH